MPLAVSRDTLVTVRKQGSFWPSALPKPTPGPHSGHRGEQRGKNAAASSPAGRSLEKNNVVNSTVTLQAGFGINLQPLPFSELTPPPSPLQLHLPETLAAGDGATVFVRDPNAEPSRFRGQVQVLDIKDLSQLGTVTTTKLV